jgi:two-component system cell cycle sensor histidine kinase PleC
MLAHMMSGNAVLDESSCDISAIVEEVILKLKSFAAMNRISLTCSLPDQPVRIRADGPRVTYSLVNLTINAIRHSPVGSEVTISVGGGAGRATVIEVRDHGVGIAPSKLVALQNCLDVPSGLFDTHKSGFGIPLAAAIARLHGGGLELESRPGAGTTAVLRFPESRSLDQGDQSAPLKLAGFAAR